MPTLTSPRRLFASSPTKFAVNSVQRQKRRRIGTVSKKRKGRQSVAQIIKNLAQEKKKYEDQYTNTTKHTLSTQLLCQNIAIGSQSYQRVGNRISLTGVGIKGTASWTGNTSTIAVAGNINTCVPFILKIYIVQTSRNDNPVSYWFQDTNSDSNLNYNSGFTIDATGDLLRSQYRMNTKEIKILARKSYTVYPKRDIQQNFQSIKNINMYVKFKKPITIQYNTGPGVVPPYGAAEVQPNVWLCHAWYSADTGQTAAQNLVSARMIVTQYYQE